MWWRDRDKLNAVEGQRDHGQEAEERYGPKIYNEGRCKMAQTKIVFDLQFDSKWNEKVYENGQVKSCRLFHSIILWELRKKKSVYERST